jgi:hypothetical protein
LQSPASYKLIKKIKDDRFDEEQLHQYQLIVQFGVRDFQAAVVEADENRVLFFEDYVLNELSNYAEQLEVIKQLFDSHPVLGAGFWKSVLVSIKNNKFVQVPSALFQPSAAPEYLRFNAVVTPGEEQVLFTSHPGQEVVTVFAAQLPLITWLQSLYQHSHLRITHQSTALIEGVAAYASARPQGNPLYIYVDRFKLHILSVTGGKLLYYNQFPIKQFSDYVKYIMLVLHALNMDQTTSHVILWGYIGKNSPHYQEFYKYIQNVAFGERPANVRFGYLFDEIQEHHFFDLFSLPLLLSEAAAH